MPNDFLTGENTQIRVVVLAPGSRARPASNLFSNLGEHCTTSDMKFGATDVTTMQYGQGKAEDGKVTRTNWMFSASGNLPNTPGNRAVIKAIRAAAKNGQEVFIERLLEGETTWEGGVASVMDFASPAPSDNIVTWSVGTFKGRGALVETPINT